MYIHQTIYQQLHQQLKEKNITLVAVSKTKPVEAIRELYDLGQRDFGENYVQEMVDKQALLPADIVWHFIGHLQTNKVKYIAPFVSLIHGVDSFKLLKEINRQAEKNKRSIDVLLQVHIAKEETKFGLDENELNVLLHNEELDNLKNICIRGLMGMASFSDNKVEVHGEFQFLRTVFSKHAKQITFNRQLQILSIGMSGDYSIAINEGSTMVRIGSLIFGDRN